MSEPKKPLISDRGPEALMLSLDTQFTAIATYRDARAFWDAITTLNREGYDTSRLEEIKFQQSGPNGGGPPAALNAAEESKRMRELLDFFAAKVKQVSTDTQIDTGEEFGPGCWWCGAEDGEPHSCEVGKKLAEYQLTKGESDDSRSMRSM